MRQTYQFILLLLTGVFFYSCQGDELSTQGNEGYLRVTLEQSAEVNTKADYKSKQMRVVIKNSAGVTKFETNDHTADLEGKELSLKQGEYTIEAVSNGWDGNAGADRAYYTGKTTVTIEKGKTATAKLVCSLANVKVTVAFEQAFLDKLGNGSIKGAGKDRFGHSGGFRPERYECGLFPGFRPDGCLYGCFSCRKDELQGAKISEVSAKDHLYIEL